MCMKKIRVRKKDVGRWITVKWDCIGRQDCLLVDVDLQNKWGKVFVPYKGLCTIDFDQVIDRRKYLNAE